MYSAIHGPGYTSCCLRRRSSSIFLLLRGNHTLLVHMRPCKASLHLYPALPLVPSSPDQAACSLRFISANWVISRSVFYTDPRFHARIPSIEKKYNAIMSVTCRFSKWVTLIESADTWSAEQWAHTFLNRLDLINWGLPRELITDRDPKFLSKFWTALFTKFRVKLLYSTAYHPQTDEFNERTN